MGGVAWNLLGLASTTLFTIHGGGTEEKRTSDPHLRYLTARELVQAYDSSSSLVTLASASAYIAASDSAHAGHTARGGGSSPSGSHDASSTSTSQALEFGPRSIAGGSTSSFSFGPVSVGPALSSPIPGSSGLLATIFAGWTQRVVLLLVLKSLEGLLIGFVFAYFGATVKCIGKALQIFVVAGGSYLFLEIQLLPDFYLGLLLFLVSFVVFVINRNSPPPAANPPSERTEARAQKGNVVGNMLGRASKEPNAIEEDPDDFEMTEVLTLEEETAKLNRQ